MEHMTKDSAKYFANAACSVRRRDGPHQAMTPQGIIQDTVSSRVKILFKKKCHVSGFTVKQQSISCIPGSSRCTPSIQSIRKVSAKYHEILHTDQLGLHKHHRCSHLQGGASTCKTAVKGPKQAGLETKRTSNMPRHIPFLTRSEQAVPPLFSPKVRGSLRLCSSKEQLGIRCEPSQPCLQTRPKVVN